MPEDLPVLTVESEPDLAGRVEALDWPDWVRFEVGDGAELVGTLGEFDLVFPDAPGGKIFKLRKTVAALRRAGFR